MKKLFIIVSLAAVFTSCQNNKQKNLAFKVNAAASKAEWKGSAPDHFHIGSFKVTGTLAANAGGLVKSGDFIIPIASIQDFDLKDPVKQVLLADLKDNFFKLATHPIAKFHITEVVPYEATYVATDTGAVKGTNYMLTGDFTVLGQTHGISFPAKITAAGDSLIAEAKFSINRNLWGMNNYSDPSKKLYILPDVNIHLTVKAAAPEHTGKSPLAFLGFYW